MESKLYVDLLKGFKDIAIDINASNEVIDIIEKLLTVNKSDDNNAVENVDYDKDDCK